MTAGPRAETQHDAESGSGGPQVAVLGLGNVLMGDDALGPYVVHQLQARYLLPESVCVEDLGTPGLDLLPHMVGRRAIVLIDTVRSNGRPGDLRLYRKAQVLQHAPSARTSPHDPGVKETLLSLDFAGDGPEEVLLVGVIPEDTSSRIGLSEAVRASVPAVLEAIVAETNRLGCPVAPRAVPLEPDLWWERSVPGGPCASPE